MKLGFASFNRDFESDVASPFNGLAAVFAVGCRFVLWLWQNNRFNAALSLERAVVTALGKLSNGQYIFTGGCRE